MIIFLCFQAYFSQNDAENVLRWLHFIDELLLNRIHPIACVHTYTYECLADVCARLGDHHRAKRFADMARQTPVAGDGSTGSPVDPFLVDRLLQCGLVHGAPSPAPQAGFSPVKAHKGRKHISNGEDSALRVPLHNLLGLVEFLRNDGMHGSVVYDKARLVRLEGDYVECARLLELAAYLFTRSHGQDTGLTAITLHTIHCICGVCG